MTDGIKRKRAQLTLMDKLRVIEAVKNNKKIAEIAAEFNCDRSTISKIKKKEEVIRNEYMKNKNSTKMRIRKSFYGNIDQALLRWYNQMRQEKAAISGPLMLEKAAQLALSFEVIGFTASNSWLERFKNRHNIKFSRIHVEKPSADFAPAEDWIENVLKKEMERYELKDVFNGDEARLCYRALQPSKDDKPPEIMDPKERITVLVAVNMDGSEKHAWVVGKYQTPRCFQRVANLPLPYYNNPKEAVMTPEIWTNILIKMNNKFEEQNRNILLLIDNAAYHQCNIPTPFVKILYVPTDTTPLVQPCDCGIIRNLKLQYRRHFNRKMLCAVGEGTPMQEFLKTITILDAMFILKGALLLISPTSIQDSFRKARFLPVESFGNTSNVDGTVVDQNSKDLENSVDLDEEAPVNGESAGSEIYDYLKVVIGETDNQDETEEDTVGSEPQAMSFVEGVAVMNKFRRFLEENYTDFDLMPFIKIEETVLKELDTQK